MSAPPLPIELECLVPLLALCPAFCHLSGPWDGQWLRGPLGHSISKGAECEGS